MDVTKAFWGELERSESDPQKAIGKCAGEQMPLANALEISVERLQAVGRL